VSAQRPCASMHKQLQQGRRLEGWRRQQQGLECSKAEVPAPRSPAAAHSVAGLHERAAYVLWVQKIVATASAA
jgi:hypothetical protein